ncbi:hypothetical protein PENSPDRAFT_753195 [Peniophora sp. CONT]|nr:hypothetical protein PENSPDRAFT_753195 [Peniophora sp. CONT]
MPLGTGTLIDGGGNAGLIGPSIHRLNDDCLTTIFHEVVYHAPFSSVGFKWVKLRAYQLVRITHVCQRWRGLAVDLAELWADVVLEYPAAFLTFLERAREAPLNTYTLTGRSISKEQVDYIVAHPERLRTLYIKDQPITAALSFAGSTLPVLDWLEFDYTDGEPHFDIGERPFHAPLLKTARFWNLYTPFVAPCLTTLDMSVDRDKSAEINVEDFRTLLKGLPLLETLFLQNCLSEEGWETESDERIELPHLDCLYITSSMSTIVSVIETLDRINDYAYISLVVLELEDKDDAAFLANTLRPYLESAPHDTLSMSGYYQDPIGGGDGSPSPTLSIWSSDKKGRNSRAYTLNMDVATGPEDIMSIYKSFFEQLSEGQIQDLRIYHPYRYNQFDWEQTLLAFHLPQFTQSVRTMEYILADVDEEEGDFGSALLPMFLLCKPVAYASLVSIRIRIDDSGSYARATSPDEMKRLLRWLRARAAANKPLRTLTLSNNTDNRYEPHRLRDCEVWEEVKKYVRVADERQSSTRW